ncbi:hypothetical protein Athai_36870 [Actinocatenispora thailandica]|uniref:PIN like domain-containing protein n=1 Tax=Actinocatenispora thailandica TaxID=227318 RepID=A0A7R7HYG1_9ACTN|nr:PIN-like domain-containing protein [Actinocatenispora thailandica]BCJ36184.1 hypothetical protein Athai_36870 [Actinocatenispora thailandica]
MTRDLLRGFEDYQIPTGDEIRDALNEGIIALDTNVLLNLYRYNAETVEDILNVLERVSNRLFVPSQVAREFWRNRQTVLDNLGNAGRDARKALEKNCKSTQDAIKRWASSTALSGTQVRQFEEKIDSFFGELLQEIQPRPVDAPMAHTPTKEDTLLVKLNSLLTDSVGDPLDADSWESAVEEGARRVANEEPPGYMDREKLESDLPEGASGDYLIWVELLAEGGRQGLDLVLITADTKEDWWNRSSGGWIIGPRTELVSEYFGVSGKRLYLLEPAHLLKQSNAVGVGTRPESAQEVERIQNEVADLVPWTRQSVLAVLDQLDRQGYAQGSVIREAARLGGRIPRDRVYELDNRDESQMLRGFTKPVARITSELQQESNVPYGVPLLLAARYEDGVKTSHFEVPLEVVGILSELPGDSVASDTEAESATREAMDREAGPAPLLDED